MPLESGAALFAYLPVVDCFCSHLSKDFFYFFRQVFDANVIIVIIVEEPGAQFSCGSVHEHLRAYVV